MAMTRWLSLAAFAAAGYAVFRRTAQREFARPRAAPEHLQTWEGEGGAVPVGGSRIAAAKSVDPWHAGTPTTHADSL